MFTQAKPRAVGIALSGAVCLGMYITYRFYIRTNIISNDRGLVIHNPIKNYDITWNEIDCILAKADLTVVKKDGEVIKVWIVQKTNLSMMRGSRSKVDEIASELESLRTANLS
jgi:hypothetical protein